MAAQLLQIDAAPVDFQDYDSDEAEIADMIADNRIAEFSEISEELLTGLIEDLDGFDLELCGYDEQDLSVIFDEEIEEQEPPPEIEFTETLGEQNNYIVLFFDNDIDWLQAQTLFDIKPVKGYSTRKDGQGEPNRGTGRVLRGADALARIVGVDVE